MVWYQQLKVLGKSFSNYIFHKMYRESFVVFMCKKFSSIFFYQVGSLVFILQKKYPSMNLIFIAEQQHKGMKMEKQWQSLLKYSS